MPKPSTGIHDISMIPHLEDTIIAQSSAAGGSFRAIIRVSGPSAVAALPKLGVKNLTLLPRQLNRVQLSLTGVHSSLPAEVLFFRAPHSYTGQDLVEIHTLGSPPLVERLIADLLAAGCRAAGPGEFTLRAFLAGKKDLPQAEAVHAVIEARDDIELQAALTQMSGGVTQPLADMREELLNLLADVEAALDFVDEDIEFVSRTDVLTRLSNAIARLTNLRRQLDDRTVSGRALRVALVGAPNAGKSSLFNALVGTSAAIVSPLPGTTRDFLVHRVEWSGITLELIDTAGWQTSNTSIEEQAQRLGRAEVERADLLLWCVPVNENLSTNARNSLRSATNAEIVLVRTKADLAAEHDTQSASFGTPTSVRTPDGCQKLIHEIANRAVRWSRSPLAPSQSRCRHHVEKAIARLQEAHKHALFEDPPELLALALRLALEQIGEMAGAVYTNDLLDRVFSRFCIGK